MTTTESMLYDIEQATARIREIYGKWENLRKAQQAYIDKLEAERDALQAQVDTLRDDWAGQILPVAIERDEARKERLRAQLDGMTIETRSVCQCEIDDVDSLPHDRVTQQRLVGPWVEVGEDKTRSCEDAGQEHLWSTQNMCQLCGIKRRVGVTD